MQFVDKALARRFEACEEMPQVLYARVFQKTRPEIGAAEEEICGGHMVFAGLGSPIGRATGAGLDRPFTAEAFDRLEEFYRAHNAPSQVDLCPLHDASVFEMFKERGYGIAELNNVLYRKLDPKEEFSPPTKVHEIRRSLPEEAAEAGAIVERAFFPEGAPEPYRGLLEPLYQMEGALAFVASIHGKMVACGTGLAIPEHRIFALGGAGTLLEYRGRGLQTALLRARMAAAAQAGCEYAVVVTN
ncbi:MAG: GNAT family N-acetyltransferase, partial [Candidatus Sulfotelmatobacter sp.]